MKSNLDKWFAMQYFQNLAWTIINLFLSIFIWQKAGGVSYLYKFYLSLFIFIPITGFISALISEHFGKRASLIISFALNAIMLVVASFSPSFFLSHSVVFGALNGTAIGLYAIPSNSSMQLLFSENLSKVTARLSSASGLNSLIIPLLGSLWVFISGGFKGVFLMGAVALMLSIAFTLKTDFPVGSKTWNYKKVFDFLNNSEFRKLNLYQVISGFKSGLEWAIFGIVILKLVGGEITGWGVINFFSALVGILAGLFYAKFVAGKKDPIFLAISSILYSGLGVILLSQFSLPNFILYFLGTSIISTFISSSTSRLTGDVFTLSGADSNSSEEFYTLLEFPLALGRIAPISLLYLFNSNLDQSFILVAVFAVVSTVPLISTFIFQNMESFKKEVV